MDLAANKAEAKKRLEDLREKYQHLLQVLLHFNPHPHAPSGRLRHPPKVQKEVIYNSTDL